MKNTKGGLHYSNLSKYSHFEDCLYYVEKENLEEAYKVAKEFGGSQMPRELTLYITYESSGRGLRDDPLLYMSYVPEYYLYEHQDESLVVDVTQKEIKDYAFCYCSIKKLCISKDVEKIGHKALRLNRGQICYQGTKQEFIDKFLGKSSCFSGTRGQILKCSDGDLEIGE